MAALNLTEMVAVVTGGIQGIGAKIVQELLWAHCRVVIADFDEVRAGLWLNEAHQNGFKEDKDVKFIECNVRDPDALNNMLEEAKKWYGRMDLICNCAGIFTKKTEYSRAYVETKLCAVIGATYKGIELMSTKNGNIGGSIINISGSCGLRIEKGIPPFMTACETGVVTFTRSMVHINADQHDGVRVACVCPGVVETKNAKLNWDRRPSTQAYVNEVGKTDIVDVVKAVVQALKSEKNGLVLEVAPGNVIKEV